MQHTGHEIVFGTPAGIRAPDRIARLEVIREVETLDELRGRVEAELSGLR